MRPALHDDSLPVLKPPETWNLVEADTTSHEPDVENDTDPDVEPFMAGYPHLITNQELNDLDLSKAKAELLGLRLQ